VNVTNVISEPPVPTLPEAQSAPGTAVATLTMPLPALLEALLFVADDPTPVGRLAEVLCIGIESVEQALAELERCYQEGQRGLRLQRKGEKIQLVSAPPAAPYIERFLGLDLTSRLSTAALETLAVIAYQQPLTRAEVEAIRGVSCDGVMRTLVARGLVEPVGRREGPGRPFEFGTTFQFLQYFGLDDLRSLPALPDGSAADS
jgi:segregation and condensation protein B